MLNISGCQFRQHRYVSLEEQLLVVLFAAGNDNTDINDGKGMWPSDLWVLGRLRQRIGVYLSDYVTLSLVFVFRHILLTDSITVGALESEYPGILKGLTYGDEGPG